MKKKDKPVEEHRSIRMRIRPGDDLTWALLRYCGAECAAFGNLLLSEHYAQRRGLKVDGTYTDCNDRISSLVRDAVSNEAKGIWKRIGGKIMSGQQTLARFSAGRALTLRARGVQLQRDGDDWALRLSLIPDGMKAVLDVKKYTAKDKDGKEVEKESKKLKLCKLKKKEPRSKPVSIAIDHRQARRDWYLRQTLERIDSEMYKLTGVKVQIQGQGKKTKAFVHLGFSKPLTPARTGKVATLEYHDTDGLLVSCEGQRIYFNDRCHYIANMKEHFAGIVYRHARSLGKAHRWHTRRRAMIKHKSFEEWAEGPLHQLSAAIVQWCVDRNVGELRWIASVKGGFPWAKLKGYVTYKCGENGITLMAADDSDKEGQRDAAGVVAHAVELERNYGTVPMFPSISVADWQLEHDSV